jgi:hypothetical protein
MLYSPCQDQNFFCIVLLFLLSSFCGTLDQSLQFFLSGFLLGVFYLVKIKILSAFHSKHGRTQIVSISVMTHRSTNEMQLWMPKVELFVWSKIWMNLFQCKHILSLMSGESWTSSQLKLGPCLLVPFDLFCLVAIWWLPLPGAFTHKWRVGPCPDAVAKHHSPPFLDLFHAGAVTRPLLDMLLNPSHCEPNHQSPMMG